MVKTIKEKKIITLKVNSSKFIEAGTKFSSQLSRVINYLKKRYEYSKCSINVGYEHFRSDEFIIKLIFKDD